MPRRPTPARSLGDELRSWDASALAALVRHRPDLARPVPADVTPLAARASTAPSCERAVARLDTAHLRALQAVAYGASDAAALALALGARPAEARTWLADLAAQALIWPARDGLTAVRAAADAVRRLPTGLGPVRTDPMTTEQITQALASVSDRARAVLDALTWDGPQGVLASAGPTASARNELVGARLLLADGDARVLLPADVGLHLRGGLLLRDPGLTRPEPAAPPRDPATVDQAAGGQASVLLATVTELAESLTALMPRTLRSGGLSVRDLGALAERLGVGTGEAELALTLAHAAGLVAPDAAGAGATWRPTTRYDSWRRLPDPERWTALALGWWGAAVGPRLVGSAAADAPLAPTPVRHAVVTMLARLAPGQGATPAEVAALLAWDLPLSTLGDDPAVTDALHEAATLGVVALGAASSAGRALVGADDADERDAAGSGGTADRPAPDPEDLTAALASAIGPHLPEPVEQVLLQADLTAVAPGPLTADREALLRATATLESRGGASVYRFSPASIRRALDAGWQADELLRALTQASVTPVPQPLEYLVRDTARSHGALRAGTAATYLRTDDPVALDEVLARRDTAVLRLERLAPTVAVSNVPLTTLLEVLRDAGLAPRTEGQGASVATPRPRRSAPPQLPRTRVDALSAAQAEEVAARVLAGERARQDAEAAPGPTHRRTLPQAPDIPSLDPVVTLVTLQEAAASGGTVWISVADALGGTQRELVRVTRVVGGRLHGEQLATGLGRTWQVSRISGVALA